MFLFQGEILNIILISFQFLKFNQKSERKKVLAVSYIKREISGRSHQVGRQAHCTIKKNLLNF